MDGRATVVEPSYPLSWFTSFVPTPVGKWRRTTWEAEMAKRTRITETFREDDPVQPRRRPRKKNANTIVIVLVLILLGLFILRRTQQSGGSVHNRHRCHGTKLLGGKIRRVRPKFTRESRKSLIAFQTRRRPAAGRLQNSAREDFTGRAD